MKKKVVSISLLFCLLTPVVTIYCFLQFQKKQVKREVKEKMIAGIDKEELVLLKFTKSEKESELRWEHVHEFEYKGHLFDIIESKIKGDTTYYWCWWDHEETKLNKKLDGLLADFLEHNPQSQKQENQLIDFFKKLFHENHADKLAVTSKHRIELVIYAVEFTTIYYLPPVPPPWISEAYTSLLV